MLTETQERTDESVSIASLNVATESQGLVADVVPSRLMRAMRIEWLGQTFASVCWIVSVLAYGISSTGDWLQLLAATSWLIANIASIVAAEAE